MKQRPLPSSNRELYVFEYNYSVTVVIAFPCLFNIIESCIYEFESAVK